MGAMKNRVIYLFFFLCLWMCPLVSLQPVLKTHDIAKVMDRFFEYHIEHKEFSPTLIRRSMKIYVEQFDPEKVYLLESEISPFLNMGDGRAKEVMERLKKEDYSDFETLNQLIQKAIVRAQGIRKGLSQHMVRETWQSGGSSSSARFAGSELELIERQKQRMIRFAGFQQTRTKIDSPERLLRVFSLFEKRVRRGEYTYLFLLNDGQPLSQEKVQHLMAVRILKSFAKSLDTHTSFFSPEEAYEMRLSLEKQYEGVGVVLSEGIDGIMIADLIPGSPAEQSKKIKVNDLLMEIDGVAVSQISFEDVLDMLKKKDKGEIILGFKRMDAEGSKEQTFKVALHKRPISMKEERIRSSTETYGDGVIGKISLHSFYENGDGVSAEKDIKEAIRQFRQKGELRGLVLDLRENSGGFLSQAVRVAGLFVANGVIVVSKYGKGEIHFLRNIVSKSYYNGPLVILTSKMSASAAEIVAQALQDYGVGLVVGDQRTFGKGSIQYQNVTAEKADLFFKVTVGRYYTVSGRSTQIEGVIADIVVPTQYAPYKIGERYLEYPLSPDSVDAAYLDPLSDLDEKTRRIFQARYLPFLQRVVSFWKKMLPTLKQNSANRLANNPNYQTFLKRLEKIEARQHELPINTVDERVDTGMEDLQMNEAVNIVKDMIILEAEAHSTQTTEAESLRTGT